MNDAHRPAESAPDRPRDPIRPENGAPGDRRSFLRGLAAIGGGVVGGALLGQSLLVRAVQAQPGPFPIVVKTYSKSWTLTQSGTLPRTETKTGTRPTTDGDPETFSETLVRPPTSVSPYTVTASFPAPGGGTQPVTVAGTRTFSFTPPMTATQNYSMRGASYTMTVSRDPTFWTATMTNSWSLSYSWDDDGGDGDGGGMPGGDELVLALARADLDTIDADGLTLFDPLHRRGEPLMLRFRGDSAG